MAETLVEQKVCVKCGAEVRRDALFCYHCGGAVEAEVTVSAGNGDSVSSGWFRENIAAEEPKTTTKLDVEIVEKTDKPISNPSDLRIERAIEKPSGDIFDAPIEKTKVSSIEKTPEKAKVTTIEKISEEPKEETKLKSAAAMRRKTKIVEKKRIEEYEWEEHENAPNLWFMLVALILIAIAGGLFFFGIYVK